MLSIFPTIVRAESGSVSAKAPASASSRTASALSFEQETAEIIPAAIRANVIMRMIVLFMPANITRMLEMCSGKFLINKAINAGLLLECDITM